MVSTYTAAKTPSNGMRLNMSSATFQFIHGLLFLYSALTVSLAIVPFRYSLINARECEWEKAQKDSQEISALSKKSAVFFVLTQLLSNYHSKCRMRKNIDPIPHEHIPITLLNAQQLLKNAPPNLHFYIKLAAVNFVESRLHSEIMVPASYFSRWHKISEKQLNKFIDFSLALHNFSPKLLHNSNKSRIFASTVPATPLH